MFFEQERINRIAEELSGYRYPQSKNIEEYQMKKGDYNSPIDAENSDNEWKVFKSGDIWGEKNERYWFKTEIIIPKEFDKKTLLYTLSTGSDGWNVVNPQFLLYVNKKPIQGLDVKHTEVTLCDSAKAGEKYTIELHAFTSRHKGNIELNSRITVLDKITEKIYFDINVPRQVAELMDENNKTRIDILKHLNNTINLIDLRNPHSVEYYESLKKANEYITNEFYDKYCGENSVTATCIGHTHIDVAWLWTLRETREKTARSFSTVLNLMKQYPEYIFMSSQPQLYKFLKQNHPEIYSELKAMVAEGRWEPEGGMWLEADCNLSSGESLIRQFLFGTRFFEKEFGIKNKILWLPDVFGYSAALPQIMKKFGIEYFMTTKIGWNEYNKMPYDTFRWEGIDGSEVLTYFVTTSDYEKGVSKSHMTTYNGNLTPSQIMGAWQRYQQKNINDDVLVCFGHGDGGGGPQKYMLENARRMEKGIPGCPVVKIEKAGDFFKKLDSKVSKEKKLPKWVGELYLEYHRGTYTTMAKNKLYNRKSEFLYMDTEFFNVLSNNIDNSFVYPKEKINNGWETILLNQFHDIIPGSSIKEVYDESHIQYEKLIGEGSNMLENALINTLSNINIKEKSIIVFNQLGFLRNDVVFVNIDDDFEQMEVVDSQGRVSPIQKIDKNKGIFYANNVPSKGYKTFYMRKAKNRIDNGAIITNTKIENKFFDISLDTNGNIDSIIDKTNNRQILKANSKANVLQAFEDKPHKFDAWDINIYYQEKMWEINDIQEIKLISNGPVRSTLMLKRKFSNSLITQYIHVYNDIPKIDFENIIDWKERQVLLKAAFPVDIHAQKATYEIQFGNVERPTHWNTSWDMAKFEVCAHKWVDLSEDNYGVSLLNDCKYGHDIKDSIMRISLIKSPTSPNEASDRTIHNFTYTLYPHKGTWKESKTVNMAYNLNCPMYAKIADKQNGILPNELSFISIDNENVIIETIKQAEDSNDIIIRMYECYNRRSEVNMKFYVQPKEITIVDLNEKDIKKIEIEGQNCKVNIKPYEILTLKLKL